MIITDYYIIITENNFETQKKEALKNDPLQASLAEGPGTRGRILQSCGPQGRWPHPTSTYSGSLRGGSHGKKEDQVMAATVESGVAVRTRAWEKGVRGTLGPPTRPRRLRGGWVAQALCACQRGRAFKDDVLQPPLRCQDSERNSCLYLEEVTAGAEGYI